MEKDCVRSAAGTMIVTPKMREKIKIRREKELADADKEFDRLLSLVAKKDAGATRRPSVMLPVTEPSRTEPSGVDLSPVQV